MFENREEAGRKLSEILAEYKGKNVVILGIARGGVVVASEVARFLHVPLHILVVKKIGAPYNSELAIGAVAPDNTVFWDLDLVKRLQISKKEMKKLLNETTKEEKKREKLFGHVGKKDLQGRTALLVDDGVATGTTVSAALLYIRSKNAKRVILATPVIAKDIFIQLESQFDKIVAVETVSEFQAVGQFYRDFPQISNEEVMSII